jgi:cytochrome c oxidase subunit 2
MAPFGMQLNDVDVAAVITYERNAWGNDSGDAVQPSTIAARR